MHEIENAKRKESERNKSQCVHNTQIHTNKNTKNTLKINQQQQAWGTDKYASAYSQ